MSSGIIIGLMHTAFSRLWWLVTPSVLSGTLTVVVTLLVMGKVGWEYINTNQLFYDQLFGAYGTITTLQASPDTLRSFTEAVLNGRLTYYILVAAGSILVGFIISMLLEAVSHLVHGTSLFIHEVREDTDSAQKAVRETLIRLGLQAASIAGWVLYILFFINILLPTAIAALQLGLSVISTSVVSFGWLEIILAGMLMALGLHLHVTFARLTFLRLRLFGGLDAEMSRLS